MISFKKALPSMITMGNVCCGFLAIAHIADGRLSTACWFIFAGMLFDMLDGKVARWTNGCSDFGVQLDSLADMISFGLAPAFLAKVYLTEAPGYAYTWPAWIVSALFLICAASRLARFNTTTSNDETSHTYFQGLATPGAAGVVASLVLMGNLITPVISVVHYKIFVTFLTFLLAAFMVSSIRYVHMGVFLLKKRSLILKGLAMGTFVTLVAIEPQVFVVAISLAFLLYAFATPLVNLGKLLLAPPVQTVTELASGNMGMDELLGDNSVQPHGT